MSHIENVKIFYEEKDHTFILLFQYINFDMQSCIILFNLYFVNNSQK